MLLNLLLNFFSYSYNWFSKQIKFCFSFISIFLKLPQIQQKNKFILFYFLLYKHQFQLSVNTKNLAKIMETDNDTNFNYYHQYCRLYLANVVLLSQMRQLANQRNQLTSRFSKLQKKGEEIQYGQTNDQDRKKRFRRTANQIERHYRCPVQTCQRSYGSQGSLNQHLKIKHFELYEQLNLGRQEIINGQQSRISQSMLSSRRQIK